MDPYKILGVDRSASADVIKQAYRRLAAKHHPDRGGDTARFQEIQSAYDTLTNPQARARVDNPGHQSFHADFGPGNFDFDSIFNIFGARFNFRPQQQARMSMAISLQDAILCPSHTVNIATEHGTNFVEIQIPPGGQLRLTGLGLPDRTSRRGDAILNIRAKIPATISSELETAIRRETGLI